MKKFIVCMIVALVLAGPALAKNGKDKGHKASKAVAERQSDDTVTIRIDIGERDIISSYLRKSNARGCPPGLAKKNNGCMPPGLAKKYRLGHPLPDDVVYVPVPTDLLRLLTPPPRGYAYVQVDKDVLLIGEASKKVIDAVTLLSAVGR